MDRLAQLRGEAGGSRDCRDASSAPSEAYVTANDSSSSKFFSLSEEDSTFDLSPLKDVSLASAAAPDKSSAENDDLISNLSPISKKSDLLDSYKIGKQIEAANILSGGVNIFDDNDNSYDGDELVIDDNAVLDNKSNPDLKESEAELPFQRADDSEGTLPENEAIASKDTEVVLQIDGKNVNAIDIGNGLYLYRKEGEEELAAVQIVDDNQQNPCFKFLKVRENAEGNLEVYEEIEIEVPKEVPTKEGKTAEKNTSHVPLKDINKVISDKTCSKIVEQKNATPLVEPSPTVSKNVETVPEITKVVVSEAKAESNKNSLMMKYNETKKSPFIHSTPNKEGIPLTKVMVNQQLHPNRHSDNVKTIEVHTDNIKPKGDSKHSKTKESPEPADTCIADKEKIVEKCIETHNKNQEKTTSEAVSEENTKKELTTSSEIIAGTNLVPQDSVTNAKTVNKSTNAKDTATDENYKANTIVKDMSSADKKDKNTSEKVTTLRTDTNEKSEIVKQDNNMLTEKDTKRCETSNMEKSKDECIHSVDKKEVSAIEKSGSKDTISVSVGIGKEYEKDLKKNEACNKDQTENKNFASKDSPVDLGLIDKDQTENKNVANKDAPVALELIKSGTETSDVNVLNKIKKIPSFLCKESVNTAKEVGINVKSTNYKNVCLPNPVKELDKSPKTDNAKIITVEKPSQIPRIANNQNKKTEENEKECKSLGPENSTQYVQQSSQSKMDITNKILVDKTVELKNPAVEKHTDLECTRNNETNNAVTAQLLTNTKIQCNNEKESKFKASGTAESHNIEKSLMTNKPLVAKPITTSAKIEQLQVVKKETPAAESIFAAKEKTSSEVILAKEAGSGMKTMTKKEGSVQNLDSPPFSDSTRKAKEEALTKDSVNKIEKPEASNSTKKATATAIAKTVAATSTLLMQNTQEVKKEIPKDKTCDRKPSHNNDNAAVPFGKWTEANRQEFLNKIKETKVPSSSSNTNQIKQPNDLNRRDVLQKIDSQRQINNAVGKVDLAAANKLTMKTETKKFTLKPIVSQDSKVPVKTEALIVNKVSTDSKKPPKQEVAPKHFNMPNTTFSVSTSPKTECAAIKTGINNQDLIDKTIEDIINRAIPGTKQDGTKISVVNESKNIQKQKDKTYARSHQSKELQTKSTPLDFIERKMNELHGIPFVERPLHELPKVYNRDIKSYGKQDNAKSPVKTVINIPNLVPFSSGNQAKIPKEKVTEIDSEEEVIEHEPITGDIELNKVNNAKSLTYKALTTHAAACVNVDNTKKETIITENDFDKFARRNSITYENCLTVNFEGREKPNVVHTVKEKDTLVKPIPPGLGPANTKQKVAPKQTVFYQSKHSSKIQITSKLMPVNEDMKNTNYPSKLQMAYQSTLKAKRQTESPITIIEDRPVKVLYMDVQSSFAPSQLNVQGKNLSPTKIQTEADVAVATSCDSVDSDMLEAIIDVKSQDKSKTKHQRKQVLTPVDTPELELIEPSDLGIEHSPKKKRKTDDIKSDKSPKSIVPKKSYLLGRGIVEESNSSLTQDLTKSAVREPANQINTALTHDATASAIDNLVKAAELLETQSEKLNSSVISVDSDSQKSTPVKRGRGRPRKYPLPEPSGTLSQDKNKTPTPQKKPRLIDAKKPKVSTVSDEESSDEGIMQENWTMGKINENIVCPICNKLFRSENVVFKHVKHCTGPSPNRSESDKRSPTRMSRQSQESDSKSSQDSKFDDADYEPVKTSKKETPKKRNSKDRSDSNIDKQGVIVIEDSPVVEKLEHCEPKEHESRKRTVKSKLPHKVNNLACDICGKTFRQSSYLANHKLQHKKDDAKKTEIMQTVADKSVFTCEVCKKEFRKLHHMVQHRLIHNPSSAPSKPSRKSSSEQSIAKEQNTLKQADDQSAAFRCEPCDKSFRKLHHLVEHRETHDGINRQKVTSNAPVTVEKSPPPPPQCEICKKTFRKLHHLIEHREQHQETSSEKSDDRSVKSALSTKDIIHECSLCYMVFPNEHSLNKHTIICQRKKRQSAAKQNKPVEATDSTPEGEEKPAPNEVASIAAEEKPVTKSEEEIKTPAEKPVAEMPKQENTVEDIEKVTKTPIENKITEKRPSKETEVKVTESKPLPVNIDSVKSDDSNSNASISVVPEISKKSKVEENKSTAEVIVIEDTPKKKTPKDKTTSVVPKRKKATNLPLPIIEEQAPIAASSDDEEVRYMLNPNFKPAETAESKLFMKVRANKRNSLQIERPTSNNLANRRTSLQHPPKISRLKPKSVESRTNPTKTASPLTKITKPTKLESIQSTDSDDSDVKYSFPETAVNTATPEEPAMTKTPKAKRNSLAEKRKSLSSIAKRKSMGKPIRPKLKAQTKQATGEVKVRRRQEVDYRCDCGQLFNSAALLSRHTLLAHTPPRIRRRRSPPPDSNPPKPAPAKTTTKANDSRKSTAKSEPNTAKVKSVSEAKTPGRKRKATVEVETTAGKPRRTPAHRGVPVPEKMKKLAEKLRL